MQTEEARQRLQGQLEEYLNALAREKHYSRNTIAAYHNDLGQFLDHLVATGNAPTDDWSELPMGVLSDYVQRLKETTLRDSAGREKRIATSTVARKIAALKSFFRYLLKVGLIETDPSRGLDTPKVKKRLPRTLSSEDIERLLEAPSKSTPSKATQPKSLRDRALLELLYATGMRVSELVSLNLSDIDEASQVVTVHSDTGNRERSILISDAPRSEHALEALRAYLARGRPHLVKNATDPNALFLNHRGQKLTRQGMWLIIKEYAEQAGIPFDVTPHTLRHSFAAHMLGSGQASLEKVKESLGHASVSTTQIYSQLTNERDRESDQT